MTLDLVVYPVFVSDGVSRHVSRLETSRDT